MEKDFDENLGPLSWVEAAHYLSSFTYFISFGPFPKTDCFQMISEEAV